MNYFSKPDFNFYKISVRNKKGGGKIVVEDKQCVLLTKETVFFLLV